MSQEATPLSDRQIVMEMVRRMPDESSLQEISEEIGLLAAIRRGQEAAEAGRVISHAELKRTFRLPW